MILRLRSLFAIALFSVLVTTSTQAAEMIVSASAGKHDRVDAIVQLPLTGEWAKSPRLAVESIDGDKRTPLRSQIVTSDSASYLTWIIPGSFKADTTRQFKIKTIAPAKSDHTFVTCDKDDDALTLSVNEQLVLRYNMAIQQPPKGTKPIYARSAYLHPVITPSGRLLTNDFPEKHLHHHGIWFPWTETSFEGRKTDFWNMGKGEGTVEFVKLDAHTSGNVFASFQVQQKHVALKAAKGKQDVLNETWHVRVYGTEKVRLFDLVSTQTCATDSPLTLLLYHYGGLGVRGSADWEGAGDACKFLTSEGLTRDKGHGTAAKWCAMSGNIGTKDQAKPAGIAILCHPENFRFPQKMRIHPSEPFFNFAPEQDGEFQIVPGKPYVSRYRFVVFDGDTDAKLCEALWNDYAAPIEAQMVK